jgi:CubicO group peptidase (beta-lactamase class C family)
MGWCAGRIAWCLIGVSEPVRRKGLLSHSEINDRKRGNVMRILKWIGFIILGLVLLGGGWTALNWDKVSRLQATLALFAPEQVVHNFSHMDEAFPVAPVRRSGELLTFAANPAPLPDSFPFEGGTVATDAFLKRRATTALFVLKDDEVRFEDYYLGTTAEDLRISWSVGKSVVSMLFGIAVEDGRIDLDMPVDHYVPALRGSGYEGVRVEDVLQMSSGIAWNEDYADFNSDINKMGRLMALGGSLDEMAASLVREQEPGIRWRYVSMNTHVLGMVLRAVTGQTLPALMEAHLWSKIGVEADGHWMTDTTGTAFALGGISIRTRDFARIGRLMLRGGDWQGTQVLPAAWVRESVVPHARHVTPGPDIMGYGYHWWLGPAPRPGEFLAIGVYGQYIYVNQPENLVIVKNSADLGFMDEIGSMHETIAFFRAIADDLAEK